MATICERGREVWCEAGNPECDAVKAAVAEINSVVPGLLVYKGEMAHEALLKLFKVGKPHITVVVRGTGVPEARAEYETLPIAFTMLAPEPLQACLPNVPIVLVWPHEALDAVAWRQVLTHEFLHSLGAEHAPTATPWSTVMRPGLSSERRVGLSLADKNWLRAVYGQE